MNTSPASRNESVSEKKTFLRTRARIIQALRSFFAHNGYLEVETPHLIPAPAPEFHIDPFISGDWFLHTSPELCMKRLVSAGYHRIFQICKCYRKGERGRLHLPEFTLLEWYRAHADYLSLMSESEELINSVATHLGNSSVLRYQGKEIDLTPPWERLPLKEAFTKYAPLPLEVALEEGAFEEMLTSYIEPQLGVQKPTIVYDYPLLYGALARVKKADPTLVERFELYIAGIEVANAFSELVDPIEQRKRFEEEEKKRREAGKVPYPMPEAFLQSLPLMPQTAGCALGVDRLVMLFTDAPDINHCVAFTPEEL